MNKRYFLTIITFMGKSNKIKVAIQFILLVGFVVALSLISTTGWRDKPEKIPRPQSLLYQNDMTLTEFAQKNSLPNPVLKNIFHFETKQDLQKKLSDFNLSHEEISLRINKELALYAENESKNWIKILIKFSLWIVFLLVVFNLLRKARINPKVRKILYLVAIILFGIIMGSDPNPMVPVKDTITLLGVKGVIFPPRIIALTIFLIMAFIANKFICSWGCHLGTFQDLIFRFNRNPKDTKNIIKQYKLPFIVSNSIRIGFFVIFILIAFLWAYDIIEIIDPFKVFKPAKLGIVGGVFIGGVFLASLFVYRPWCHLFCPFGLVGWFVEKVAVFKINVNYETCKACETCARVCPSTAMDAILKQKKVIPDCFACGSCIDICPTDSIKFQAGKRNVPPVDKFRDKKVGKNKGKGV